jgi:hypothetical protein
MAPTFWTVLNSVGEEIAGEDTDENLDELRAMADQIGGSVVKSTPRSVEVIHPIHPAAAVPAESTNKENDQ